MRTIKQLILVGTLILTACTSNPELPDAAGQVLFALSCGNADATTRSLGSIAQQVGDETPHINDLNVYLFLGDYCIHGYLKQSTWTSRLQKGNYDMYIVANAGQDLGERTAAELSDLKTSDLLCDTSNTLLLSAHQSLQILHDAAIEVPLQRVVARITINIAVDTAFRSAFKLKSYRICNVPQYAYLFAQDGTSVPSAEVCNLCSEVKAATSNTTISDVVYLYENIKPQNTAVTTPAEKSPQTAPEGAMYVHIMGTSTYDDSTTQYYCYLGENDTSDFSVRRNSSKEYTITIKGQKTTDVRLNTTTVIADDEGSTYCDLQTYPTSNSSAVFDLGTFIVTNTTSAEYLRDRCWIVFPAGDQYTFDDGKTWNTAVAGTPVLLTDENNYTFSVKRPAALISSPHEETTPPFTLYYGLEGHRMPLVPDFDYSRKYGYTVNFDLEGMPESNFSLQQLDSNSDCVAVLYGGSFPIRLFMYGAPELYFSFSWSNQYRFLGFRDKYDVMFNPTDYPDDCTDTYWSSGTQIASIFWEENRGSSTVDMVFEKKIYTSQQSLYIPTGTAYTIDVAISGSYTRSTIDGYDIYTMPAGTQVTASLSTDGGPYGPTAQDFEAWTYRKYAAQTDEAIGTTSSSITFNMAESGYLRPTWKPCSRLDADDHYANCYMIHTTNVFYAFSALYGGSSTNPLPKPDAVQIEWTDALDNGSTNIAGLIDLNYDASSGLVYIRWDSQQLPYGSMLLKAVIKTEEEEDDDIIWTWHIWFTSYYPVADSYGLMTRNLGALADANDRTIEVNEAEDYTPRAGYFYQHGRQIPFILNGKAYTIVNSLSPEMDKLALSGHGVLKNWGDGVKEFCDPCPYGWRVPTYSEMTAMGIGAFAANKTQQSFYSGAFTLPAYGVMWAYSPLGSQDYHESISLSGRSNENYNNVTFATAYATSSGYICPILNDTGTSIYWGLKLYYGDSKNRIEPIAGMVRCIKE